MIFAIVQEVGQKNEKSFHWIKKIGFGLLLSIL